MTFDDLLQAHSQWKLRLLSFVEGNTKEFPNLASIGRDDKCVLGQWIYGEGSQYSAHPEFTEIVREHANFHRAAATIIKLVMIDKLPEARKELAHGGDFNESFIRTSAAIKTLRDKVQGQA